MKPQRKSFLFILLICFWLGYTTLSIVQTVFSTVQVQEKLNSLKNDQINFLLETSQQYMASENWELLKQQMDKAVKLEFINFFCLKNNEGIQFEYYPRENTSTCSLIGNYKYDDYTSFYKFPNHIIRPLKLDQHLLVVGYGSNIVDFILTQHKENFIPLVKDIIIITLFMLVLAYLILKDFITIDQILRTGNKSKLFSIKGKTKESNTLIQSAQTLEKIKENDLEQIIKLQNSLGTALSNEIKKQTPSLTSLTVAVLRIDLNGYTQIFLEKKEEHIVNVLNEYFSITNDLINRYQGEIYQIIGDEIVVIFKSNPSEANTFKHVSLRSLFCVRAIFSWAHDLDITIQSKYGHRFLLKSSISLGHLRFVKLNTGFSFAGLPLIESVRLLGCVSDKSENSLIVPKDYFLPYSQFFNVAHDKSVQLKGFGEHSLIFEIKDFTTWEKYFQHLSHSNEAHDQKIISDYLEYFKSNTDIFNALKQLNYLLNENNFNVIFYLFKALRTINVEIALPDVSAKLYEGLANNSEKIIKNSSSFSFLPGLIQLIPCLVHRDLWTNAWSDLLILFLKSDHPRIVANASDVYFYYHPSFENIKTIFLDWQDNNRISANYLLARLKKEISHKDTSAIVSWLKQNNVLFQASALYVIEELHKYYFNTNPIVYKTNDDLKQLINIANNLSPSNDKMVQLRLDSLLTTIALFDKKLNNQGPLISSTG